MKSQADNLISFVESKKTIDYHPQKRMDVQIYTIASGKGGVGKTNFVVSVAIALQRLGMKVLILDADLGLANVDILLGASPKSSLYDVMFKGKKLDEIIIDGPEGIKIIPGGSGILELSKLDVMEKKSFLSQFKKISGFDIILIDTGAGISMNQLSFITFSDEVILVATPEPTSITDVYSVVKIISTLKLQRKLKIIVNRVKNKEEGAFAFNKLNITTNQFLDIDLDYLGYIYDDNRVHISVMEQVPFIIQFPKCLASQCINQLAKVILNHEKNRIKVKSIDKVYNRIIKIFG